LDIPVLRTGAKKYSDKAEIFRKMSLPPSMFIVEDINGFQDLAYSFFANNNMCMVWSQLADIRTPPIVTTDFTLDSFVIGPYKKRILVRYKKIGFQK
jgi:hypothetical protein